MRLHDTHQANNSGNHNIRVVIHENDENSLITDDPALVQQMLSILSEIEAVKPQFMHEAVTHWESKQAIHFLLKGQNDDHVHYTFDPPTLRTLKATWIMSDGQIQRLNALLRLETPKEKGLAREV